MCFSHRGTGCYRPGAGHRSMPAGSKPRRWLAAGIHKLMDALTFRFDEPFAGLLRSDTV